MTLHKDGTVAQHGTLYYLCGKMGAGKSTLSRQLAQDHQAVVLSEDDWLAAHYPGQINTFDDYIEKSRLIKPFIKAHVQSLLQLGLNVVMDFPANTRRQRAWFVELSETVQAEHQLYYLDVSDTQCLAQLAKRRIEQPARAQFDNEAVFYQVSQYFEAPEASENLTLAHTDSINES
ncbi:AAA family ATPase [Pseudoalteromonas ardens]|uniref:AAA family ATPase n=1 Tax=Pseudoalteromonas ardens TaxID=3048490 RepID=UPI0024C3300E|nr:ATP-binding protein [Pseudoalteromonas sp. R96]MDK1312286.1 ATP-binding protein [Pseudoalteromonas sp. R96]